MARPQVPDSTDPTPRTPAPSPELSVGAELFRHEIRRSLIHWLLAGLTAFAVWSVGEERLFLILPLLLIAWGVADVAQWGYAAYRIVRRRRRWADIWSGVEALSTLELPPADDATERFYDAQCRQMLALAGREIDETRSLHADYRAFIELWVHEIKTPLHIQHLILANHTMSPEVRARFERSLRQLEEQVSRVLYYARSRNPERDYLLRTLDPADVVRATIRALSDHLIEEDVVVDTDFVPATVLADEKWLRFMITQVVHNAIQYAGDAPPHLCFATRRTPRGEGPDAAAPFRPGETHFGPLSSLDDVIRSTAGTHLIIRDHGIGIRAHELVHVTDEGFTGLRGRSYHRSTGMGLSIVRKLAEKLGLMMGIYASDAGTAVIFTFPLDDPSH